MASKGVPPHSVEAEEGVIGSVLIRPDALPSLLEVVQPADFYRESHRKVYGAMAALYGRGDGVDLITLTAELGARGELEDVGGAAALSEISERVPTSANALSYARIVRQMARRRELLAGCRDLGVKLLAGGGEDGPLHEWAPAELARLIDIAHSANDREETLSQTLARVAVEAERRHSGEVLPAIPTGLDDLDDRIGGGIRLGHLIVVAGVSSHGKTSFAERITEQPLRNGVGVAWISADTDRAGLIERMACQRAGVCANDFALGRTSIEDQTAVMNVLAEIDREPLQIIDNVYDWSQIKVSSDRAIANGAQVLVFDHLTLFTNQPAQGRRIEYHEEIAGITRDLQQLTRRGVAVVLLVQIDIDPKHRDKHGKLSKAWRPKPSMLRGGKTTFQNANTVLLLYWHGREHPDEPGTVVEGWEPYEVHVAKAKTGDATWFKLRWHPPTMRLVNYFHPPGQFVDDDGSDAPAQNWLEQPTEGAS